MAYNSNKNYNKKKVSVPKQQKSKKVIDRPEGEWGTPFQYKMSALMAEKLLEQAPRGCDSQKYLCDYINSLFNLKGYCELVVIG